MMRVASLILAIIFVVALFGCTTEEKTALTGGAIGTAAGAIIGHQSGETATGALIGGTVGLLGGYLYGKSKTKKTETGEVAKFVECPKCGTNLQLPATAAAGNKIRCGNCKTEFILQ
jgi:membrane protease subunit (stomatin/prohibitin family)